MSAAPHLRNERVHRSDEMNLRHRRRRPRFEIILLIPALLGFTGCMVGPNFQRPRATVPANWLESGDGRVSTESASYRSWWSAFDDPTLDRLIEQAYRENLSLRRAGVRVLQARAELGIAVGEIFPQTQQGVGSVQYSRLSDRAVASVASNGSVTYWQSQIGAQASWERRTNWGQLLAPATYNLPASREPDSAPRRPDW